MHHALVPDRLKPGQRTAADLSILIDLRFMVPVQLPRNWKASHKHASDKSEIRRRNCPIKARNRKAIQLVLERQTLDNGLIEAEGLDYSSRAATPPELIATNVPRPVRAGHCQE